MNCGIVYKDKLYSDEDFRAYVNANYHEFRGYQEGKFLDSAIDYSIKAVDILSSEEAIHKFKRGDKAGWPLEKILTELQIPKTQKELLLSFGTRNRDELLTSLLANYSYTVEINTSIAEDYSKTIDQGYNPHSRTFEYNGYEYELDDYEADAGLLQFYKAPLDNLNKREAISKTEFDDALKNISKEIIPTIPTQHYSNMTVPGGTNYTENEIRTPDITPSIKGHAQFSTDQGIGWHRSDDRLLDFDKLLAVGAIEKIC